MAFSTGRAIVLGVAVALMAAFGPAARAGVGAESGLPLPRFVSLHASEVNVRTGPGVRYPVEWVFVKRGLPVEVAAEFENWRKVRDWQGTEGWVHQSMLTGRRHVIVMATTRALRREAREGSVVVARAEPGVIGRLLECEAIWCRVKIAGFKGWLMRDQVWGVYQDERVD
jgi:SH3-like domain-containing protein